MSAVDLLRHKRLQYEEKISSRRRKIRQVEYDHDSLVRFKRQVQQTQGEVESANTTADRIMDAVADVRKNSRPARAYYSGMKGVLSGIGVKLMPLAFGGMLDDIDRKLRAYRSKVVDYEDDIDRYQAIIRDLDHQIALAEEMEEAMEAADL